MEMMHGRRGLDPVDVKRSAIARWADEGEKWLNEQFKESDLEFHTKWDTEAMTITLEVFKVTKLVPVDPRHTSNVGHAHQLLFAETCRAENFVTRLMVTKIMMVM